MAGGEKNNARAMSESTGPPRIHGPVANGMKLHGNSRPAGRFCPKTDTPAGKEKPRSGTSEFGGGARI
jgi:hypothetical protein